MDITFKSVTHKSCNGYPQSKRDMMEALRKVGVNLIEDRENREYGLCYGYPHNIQHLEAMKIPKKMIFTMFESTKIPDDWVEHLEKAYKVFVPSRFCQRAMENYGIEAHVVPLGYNPDFFQYYERPKRDVYRFIHYDAYGFRKGWDITFNAFRAAFEDSEDVELVFKTIWSEKIPPMGEYKNIRWIKESIPREKMQGFLNDYDCMVFPSRGEGFGHTPLEAMATGMPVMIPNASGMSEYFDPLRFIGLKWHMVRARYDHYRSEDTGYMYNVEPDYLAKMMREAYEKRDAEFMKTWSKENAEWVKKNWTYENTAQIFKSKLPCG